LARGVIEYQCIGDRRDGNPRGAQLTREEKVAVVEAYLKGLVSKDISKVPFATDITFEGPRVPPLAGREVVVGFLKMILPAIIRYPN
jgi:hypothetical protein